MADDAVMGGYSPDYEDRREAASARARQRRRLADGLAERTPAAVKPPPGKCWRHDYLHREYVCTCEHRPAEPGRCDGGSGVPMEDTSE